MRVSLGSVSMPLSNSAQLGPALRGYSSWTKSRENGREFDPASRVI